MTINKKVIMVMSCLATAVTGLAGLVSSFTEDKMLDYKIEEKVNEAIDKRENEEES